MSSPKMTESVELEQDLKLMVNVSNCDRPYTISRDLKIMDLAAAISESYGIKEEFHLTRQKKVLNMNACFSDYKFKDGDRIVVKVKGTGRITGVSNSPSLVPILPTPSQSPASVQIPAPIDQYSALFRISNQNLAAGSFVSVAPGGWLDDLVVDIMMRRKYHEFNLNPSNYILPNSFVQYIEGPDFTTNLGVFPSNFVQLTATLYMATFISNHWVLTVIDFPTHTITIYDSSPGLHDLNAFVTRLRDLLFEKTLVPQDSWTTADGNCQQQRDGSSCGLWVIKNFECLLQGTNPMDLDVDEVHDFRTEISELIFMNKTQLGNQAFEAFEKFSNMDPAFIEARRIANLIGDPQLHPPLNPPTPQLQSDDFIVPSTALYEGPLLKKAQELDAKYREKDNLSLDSLKKAQITTSGRPQKTAFFPSPYLDGRLVLKDMLVQTSVTSIPQIDRYCWIYNLTPAQQLTMNVVDKPLTTKDKYNKVHYVSGRLICGVCFPRSLHQTAMKKVKSLSMKYGCFTTMAELKLHLRDVHQEPQLLCEHCSRTFARKSHLKRHKERHTFLPYCGFCEVEFQTKDELRSHTFNDTTHSKKIEIALQTKPFPHFKKADDDEFFDKITPFYENFQGEIYKRCRKDSCRVCDHSIGVSQIRYQDLILKTEFPGGAPVSCDTMRAGIYLCLFQRKENQGDPSYMKRPDYFYSTSKYEEEPAEVEEPDEELEFQKEVEEDVKKLQLKADYLGAYGGQFQCGYRSRMQSHFYGNDGVRVKERFLNDNLIKILVPIWSTTPSLLVDYCERHLIRTANLQDYWAGNLNVEAGGRRGFQYDD